MNNATLKRTSDDSGIPIHSVNPIEDVGKEKTDSSLLDLCVQYESVLAMDQKTLRDNISEIKKDYNIVLSPSEIVTFPKCLEERKVFGSWNELTYLDDNNTGFFVSMLMENSYNAGNNEFSFAHNHIEFLASYIRADKNNPLKVNISINSAEHVGLGSKNLHLSINYCTCGYIGETAENISLQINEFVTTGIYISDRLCGLMKNSVIKSPCKDVLEYAVNSLISFCPKNSDMLGNRFFLLEDGAEKEYFPND